MGTRIIRLIEAKKQKVQTADFPSGQKLEEYARNAAGKPDRLRLFEIEEGKETKVTEFTSYKELGKYASRLNGNNTQSNTTEVSPRTKKGKLFTNELQKKVVAKKQEINKGVDGDKKVENNDETVQETGKKSFWDNLR